MPSDLSGADQVEQLAGQRPVPADQVLDGGERQPVVLGQPPGRGADRGEAVRAEQRQLVGDRRRRRPRQALHRGVHHVPGHQPVGGELPAGDRREPGQRHVHHVLPRQFRGRGLGGGRDERSQAGVDADDVRPGERLGEDPVGRGEDVVDVLAGGGGLVPLAGPLGVGGADDPPLAPRDEEQHALLGADDHAGVGVDGGPGHHQVHALGHPHLVTGPHPVERVHQVGPHPGAHHHPLRQNVDRPVGFFVKHPGADHRRPVRRPQQRRRARPGHHDRAVRRRGPRHGDRVPGVVHLRVVVDHRAGQPVGAQRGRAAQRAARAEVPVVRDRAPGALHRVIDHQAGAHVRPLHDLPVQRIEERHRPDQVRREPGDEQVAFPQRLPHQLEVALLQVPQAAVDQLARPARRAGGEVTGLDQTHPQAPGRGVQRGPRAGDAAAHHQDIERARGQLLQRCGPVTCVKSTGHGRFLPPFPLVIHGMCRDRPVRLGARDVAHCRREVDARRVAGPPRDVLIGPHQQELLPGVVRGRRDHGEGDRQRTGPF